MKRHRLLSLALALLMALSFLPVKAHATNSDFVIEDGTLKEYRGPGGDVVIPEGVTSIEGYRSLTQPEGRLIWDKEKLETFPEGRVYGPGDAWFSSTDGVHDTVTFAHFPHLNFPAYRALGRLMRSYHSC